MDPGAVLLLLVGVALVALLGHIDRARRDRDAQRRREREEARRAERPDLT